MSDPYLEEAMRIVLEKLSLDPEVPYSVEPVHANLWLSSAYRIKVGNSDVSLFVKRLPEDLKRREFFESQIFFSNEAAAYTHVFSEFDKFQREKGLDKPATLTPKCHYTMCDGNNDIIILEDLSVEGFYMPDRKKRSSLEHLTLLMKVLGKFHALSLAMKNQEPERFQELSSKVKETIWSKPHYKTSDNIFTKYGLKVHNALREQMDPECSRKLEAISSRNGAALRELSRTDSDNEPWNVVTHGDLWLSNILISADSSSLRFVDFQQCRYASPGLDVSSVLFLCMDGPMRASHAQHLLTIYHTSLCDFLNELGSSPDIFPFNELKRQLVRYGRYALGVGFVNIPHSMNEGDDGDLQTDSETSVSDAMEKECNVEGEACKKRLLDIIIDAANWGYI